MKPIPAYLCKALDLPIDRPWWSPADLNSAHRANAMSFGHPVYCPEIPGFARWDGLLLRTPTRDESPNHFQLDGLDQNNPFFSALAGIQALLANTPLAETRAVLDKMFPLARPAFQLGQVWVFEHYFTSLQVVSGLNFRDDQLVSVQFSGGTTFAISQLTNQPSFLVSEPYWSQIESPNQENPPE